MKPPRFTRPPRNISRQRVKLDNITLIPASLLPHKEHWQQIANGLNAGEILLVLPSQAKQQPVAQSVASQLREKGKFVRVVHREPYAHSLFSRPR